MSCELAKGATVADTDAVTVRFVQTAALLVKGHWAMYARRTLYVGLALFALSIVALAATMKSSDAFSTVLGVCIGLSILLPAALLDPWLRYKRWMKEPNMARERQITVDDACLQISDGTGEARYEWSMFTLLRERRELFVLRLGKMRMFVIPKTAFTTQDDLARFREIVASKIRG